MEKKNLTKHQNQRSLEFIEETNKDMQIIKSLHTDRQKQYQIQQGEQQQQEQSEKQQKEQQEPLELEQEQEQKEQEEQMKEVQQEKNIDNIDNVDNIDNIDNIDDIDNTDNIDNTENIENIDQIVFYIKSPELPQDKEIKMKDCKEMTVIELKEFSFPAEFNEGKNIRFILQGRQLKNEDKITSIGIKSHSFIHAFITEHIDQPQDEQRSQQNVDISQRVRGFERMKDYGVSDVDVTLQRFAFQSQFILLDKDNEVELNNLVDKEEEWIGLNFEAIQSNPLLFKEKTFVEEPDHKYPQNKGYKFEVFFGFLIGFILNILAFIFPLTAKYTKFKFLKISKNMTNGIFYGTMAKIIYFMINYYFFGRLLSIII